MELHTDARRDYGRADALRDAVVGGLLVVVGGAWLLALSPLGVVAGVLHAAGRDAYRPLRMWWVGLAVAVVGGSALLDATGFARERVAAVRPTAGPTQP